MSFHTPDTYGNLVLLFSVEIDLCPIVLNSQWGFSYSKDHSNELSIQLVVYDQPDDPLNIPFVFNTQTQRHPSEMVRFIEQEILTVYILTIQSGGLCYFDARSIQIPENFKQELTTDIREMLSQTN